jgi:hypothetical protein
MNPALADLVRLLAEITVDEIEEREQQQESPSNEGGNLRPVLD